ncbi:MAG: hypothetical protein IPL88_04685 [Rhizobiales bacterium]|nr:hypothetical protein [Hyphomicrobiales bacterium]
MKLRIGALAFGCAMAAVSAAQASSPEFLQRLMGAAGKDGRQAACFKRVYDAAHLKSHPQQNVQRMTLLVVVDPDAGSTNPSVSLGVDFRRGKNFQSGGSCGEIKDEKTGAAQALRCGVDCDGGEIGVSLKDDRSVRVTIPDGARLWRPGRDDDDMNSRRRFGADDKLFRVDRTSGVDCLSLTSEAAVKALLRGAR